jgi:hypothetical protein
MILTLLCVFGFILLASYLLFQPICIKISAKADYHAKHELHEAEDIRTYMHADNFGLSARYYNSIEDKLM